MLLLKVFSFLSLVFIAFGLPASTNLVSRTDDLGDAERLVAGIDQLGDVVQNIGITFDILVGRTSGLDGGHKALQSLSGFKPAYDALVESFNSRSSLTLNDGEVALVNTHLKVLVARTELALESFGGGHIGDALTAMFGPGSRSTPQNKMKEVKTIFVTSLPNSIQEWFPDQAEEINVAVLQDLSTGLEAAISSFYCQSVVSCIP